MAFLKRTKRLGDSGAQGSRAVQGDDLLRPGDLAVPMQMLARMAPRAAVTLALTAGFLWLLADRLQRIDLSSVAGAVAQLSALQWLQAIAFTALSFWAVGRYDAVLHRHFATGIPARAARRAGIAAIAVSQTLGFGIISGAILRWRMLPGFTLLQATGLTAAVALSFLAGWAVVTSAVLVLVPEAPFRGLAALALTLLAALAGLSILGIGQSRLPFRWPNSFVLARLIGLCAVDSLAAALAFHALSCQPTSPLALAFCCPPSFWRLARALPLARPGGMGAFEVTLLALLPATAEPGLLVAILGWRIVYYVIPALLGAALAIRGPVRMGGQTTVETATHPAPPDLSAETGLHHQGDLALHRLCATSGAPHWLLGPRGHVLFALFDPTPAPDRASLDHSLIALRRHARDQTRLFAVYKCGPRLAARAARLGLAVRRVGWEATLNPARYRLACSSRSGLRRKLRRAEAAGVTVQHMPADLAPWPALDCIAADWAHVHKGERGFSMGRHERRYLSQQRLYVAAQHGQPIAYASFHTSATEWTLDLMRHGSALPDGTMHSLIQAAIDDAQRLGIARLSLAAVPEAAFARGDLATRLVSALAPETAATGLLRFKSSFAPLWSPRYLVAEHRLGLVVAGLSLWRAITRPSRARTAKDRPKDRPRPHARNRTARCGIWVCLQPRPVAHRKGQRMIARRMPWPKTPFPNCSPAAIG